MSDYSTDIADAVASIREAGRQVVMRRLTRALDGAGNITGTTKALGGTLDVLGLTISKGEPLDDSQREALVANKLRKFLVAAGSAPARLAAGDILLFEGLYWRSAGCSTLRPGTQDILYTTICEMCDLDQGAIDALALTTEEAALAAA